MGHSNLIAMAVRTRHADMQQNYHVHQFHMDCNYMVGHSASVVPEPQPQPRTTRVPRNNRVAAAGVRARVAAVASPTPSAPPETSYSANKPALPANHPKNSEGNRKTADRILDLIQNEIDLQGKCIEDLSKELRFHLEKKREEFRSGEVLEELKSIRSEMKAHRTELSELRHDFSRLMQQQE